MKIKVVGAMACWCMVVAVGDNIVDISAVVGMMAGGVVMSMRCHVMTCPVMSCHVMGQVMS